MVAGAALGLEICKIGIQPPAETWTVPTIMTLLRVIPPCPILQFGSRPPVVNACYAGMSASPINFSLGGPRTKRKRPYREKSVNDASNELCEPLQRYFIAMSGLIPDLYLAFPSFIAGPLRGNNVVNVTVRRREE